LISHIITGMAGQANGGGGGSMVSTVVMFSLIILIFYFMILRPQQKTQKERQKMLESVQKGDKIVVAGLHGTVVGVEDKTVLIQVADNVKLKYDRAAISAVIRPSADTTAVGKTS
jgi:preprotein translocase subunit YajC